MVIDTKSSETIIKDIFGKGTKVLSCIGPNYKYFGIWKYINVFNIFFSLLIYDKIFMVKLGMNNDIKQLSKQEFKNLIKNKTDDINYSIFAFVRE